MAANGPRGGTTVAAMQLSRGWSRIGLVTWSGALLALAAVAVTSRTVGKPVWWIGPSTDPSSFVSLLVPVTLTVAPAMTIVTASHRSVRTGLACSAGIAVMAVFDAGGSPGAAVIQAIVALATAAISVALRAGATTVAP